MAEWALPPTDCVDGCAEPVLLIRVGTDSWRVQHGPNPEHSRAYDLRTLFVTTGYAPWAREVHKRNAPTG